MDPLLLLLLMCFFEFFGKGTCFHVIFWNLFWAPGQENWKRHVPKVPKTSAKSARDTPPPIHVTMVTLYMSRW